MLAVDPSPFITRLALAIRSESENKRTLLHRVAGAISKRNLL